MKPRIRLRLRIWDCRLPGDRIVVGFGFTPAEAYEEWARQMIVHWRCWA